MSRQTIFELAWILPSIALPVAMLVAIVITAFGMQVHVPTNVGVVNAATVDQTPPFDKPGLTQIAPGRYQLVLVARTWSFNPDPNVQTPPTFKVPVGSQVDIVATSRDVIHGLYFNGADVNLMLIPGRIGRLTASFSKPGEYLFVCHEYCGVGHQTMYGKIVVEGQ